MLKKFFAELIAGFIIVFVGAGIAAIVSPTIITISLLVVGLGFFLAVILVSYTVGEISGGHGNPSITVGMMIAGKLSVVDGIVYIVGQLIGSLIGGFLIYLAISSTSTEISEGILGTNIIASGQLMQAGLFEAIMTCMFIIIILAVTDEKNSKNKMAPVVIGLTLATFVMLSSPITGGSLNATRSLGVAVFEGGTALSQLPIFLAFPTIGGAIGGAIYSIVRDSDK